MPSRNWSPPSFCADTGCWTSRTVNSEANATAVAFRKRILVGLGFIQCGAFIQRVNLPTSHALNAQPAIGFQPNHRWLLEIVTRADRLSQYFTTDATGTET